MALQRCITREHISVYVLMYIVEVPYVLIRIKAVREYPIRLSVFEVTNNRLIIYVCFSELCSALAQPEY